MELISQLAQNGLLALLLALSIAANIYQYKDGQTQDVKILDLQEKRLLESKEREGVNTELLRQMNSMLDKIFDRVDKRKR